jgi:MoaA/NifB/PqqE/SkfB family radical SAM enzyme
MSIDALLNTLGTKCRTLPLVILYVTEGCNLRCISCSYRSPSPGELTLEEIARLAGTLKNSGLRHIVYSGGEPLLRRDFPGICTLFEARHIRQSLLTNGLLLEKRFGEIGRFFGEIIVSLDGPDEVTHNAIRGGDSYRQIVRGIRSAAAGGAEISVRTVIQKRNFRKMTAMVRSARDLGVSRISFLAADVRSQGFGRASRGHVVPAGELLLDAAEVEEYRSVIGRAARDCREEFSSSFIAESPEKLMRLADYFDALNGKGEFPGTTCNAPMVSAVITSTGALLPCYFLPSFGNIRESPLSRLLNAPEIRSTRRDVRAGTPAACRTCVCTLHVRPSRALMGTF